MKKTKEKDHYIKEIFKLEEVGEKVTVSALSKLFKVSKSSVSNMLKKLSLMELVDTSPYKRIKLTSKGRKFAKEVVAKHRLIESFLVEIMQFNPNEVHEIAEEIEHINSPVFFSKVRKMLKQDITDPHGSNIPKTDF
tara:strand:+ start:351 stop:761 length:411 start_codon:yes stop_codon:yes gene_type:complete